MSSPSKNKANAESFYDLMFNRCRPAEAIERFIEHFERMARVSDAGFCSTTPCEPPEKKSFN